MYELLAEWRDGLEGAEYEHIQQLLDANPTLLWQTIPFNELEYPNTMTLFRNHSKLLFKGQSISHVYSIQFLMFIIFENSLAFHSDEAKLLSFLIESATAVDLNTCFWGSTKNTTLHLASILGQPITIIQQLLDRGASSDIPNSNGYFAKDFSPEESIKSTLSTKSDNTNPTSTTESATTAATTNRFERLRQLAEEGGGATTSNSLLATNPIGKRQNSTRKYFQPGHLEERRRKVLQDDGENMKTEQDDKSGIEKLKKNNIRQREVESLAKQSRVKNNPFLKQFEDQHKVQQERRPLIPPLNQNGRLNPRLEVLADRRVSKGINTLKGGSFVSTSVFRRHQDDIVSNDQSDDSDDMSGIDDTLTTNNESITLDENSNSARSSASAANDGDQRAPSIQSQEEHSHINEMAILSNSKGISLDPDVIQVDYIHDQGQDNELKPQPNNITNDQSVCSATQQNGTDLSPVPDSENTEPPIDKTGAEYRLSPTRRSHMSMISDAESEQWFDSNEEYAENEARKSTILSISYNVSSVSNDDLPPLPTKTFQQSAIHTKRNSTYKNGVEMNNHEQPYATQTAPESCINGAIAGNDGLPRLSHETELSHETFKFNSPPLTDDESINTWPPPSPKSDIHNRRDSTGLDSIHVLSPQFTSANEIVRDTDESQTTVNDHENQQINQGSEEQPVRPVILATSSNFVVRRLSLFQKNDNDVDVPDSLLSAPTSPPRLSLTAKDVAPQQAANVNSVYDEKDAAYSTTPNETNQAETTPENIPHPILPLIPETVTSGYGKIYIRMTNAHDILLPLPAETTYVRCVISDGRQEYVSRYEVMSSRIQFQYECTMDTYPNMIVSIALQVRPDPHVRPLTGFLNKLLFTSIHRQKKTLQGYVHPEEYFIGQARFAIEDMTAACNQKTYNASFDCFNSWFVQSTKERKRGVTTPDGQVIKVVGQLAVDMLYLPVSDPSMNIPVSLQECDIALRIRQWHGTCWRSGYLSTRKKSETTWSRQYFRLIGSQLLGFDSAKDSKSYVDHYDITDAVQLIVAAEQVLVNMDSGYQQQQQQIIFSQNTICEDNRKGFFRITFSNGGHIDCVSDQSSDSELWVKTLRAMIGRVPLTVSASIFLE